ncbi:hypothetical protein PVW51_01965 [Sulfitobacter sp. PR48]|uniref:hypothetical protein n=1 Tax=Sulfitobacter sp. PR48 TaxID=3028383 RepID=UPI00237BD502|nr:hypothetical protein [Sulfitobacter sp. PR48]MDD9719435.1 hypothetical protein [Sulfitobacter sp. PR48]
MLVQITRAGYDREKYKLQKILAEEATLRAELLRLDELNSRARLEIDESHRAIGADVLWQAWIGRAKTALNMKLARLRAVKEHHQNLVRKAYGKVLVADELRAKAQQERRQRQVKHALHQAIDGSLF